MVAPTFSREARNWIREIMDLSEELGTDSSKIIEMMQHHTREIKELFEKGDSHFAVETGDLIVLALELLMREGYDPDEVMSECYGRFDRKLTHLLREKSSSDR